MEEMIQCYAEPRISWKRVIPFLDSFLFIATCNLKAKNTHIGKPQTQTFFFSLLHSSLKILSQLDHMTFKDTELVSEQVHSVLGG